MRRHFSPRLFILAAAFILSLTACVPARLGVSWASLSTIGEEQNILVAYNNFLALVNPANGKAVQLLNAEGDVRRDDSGNPLLWDINAQSQSAQFFSAPLPVDEDTFLITDYNKRLFRIDLENARIENPSGVTLPGHVIADSAVVEDHIYMPMFDGDLTVRELAEPENVIWSYNEVNTNKDDQLKNGVWSKPLVVENTVYFSSMDHFLYAVSAETGKLNWKVNLEGALASTPVLYNNRLYVGSFARKLFELNPENGEITAEFDTQDWVWSSPVIVDDTLYMTDLAGYVYALKIGNGFEPVWSGKKTRTGIRPSPLVTENYVIVASRDGQAVWLNRASGEVAYENEIGAEVLSEILVIQPNEALDIPDSVVVFSSIAPDKTLVAFTLDDAARQWTYAR